MVDPVAVVKKETMYEVSLKVKQKLDFTGEVPGRLVDVVGTNCSSVASFFQSLAQSFDVQMLMVMVVLEEAVVFEPHTCPKLS